MNLHVLSPSFSTALLLSMNNIWRWQVPSEARLGALRVVSCDLELFALEEMQNDHQCDLEDSFWVFSAQAIGPKPSTNYSAAVHPTKLSKTNDRTWEQRNWPPLKRYIQSRQAVDKTALSEHGKLSTVLPCAFVIVERPQQKYGFYVPTICRNLCFKALTFSDWDWMLLFERKQPATFSNLLKVEASPFSLVAPPTSPTGGDQFHFPLLNLKALRRSSTSIQMPIQTSRFHRSRA